MIKYGMAFVGQSVTTNEISKLQRRAGINVTGVIFQRIFQDYLAILILTMMSSLQRVQVKV